MNEQAEIPAAPAAPAGPWALPPVPSGTSTEQGTPAAPAAATGPAAPVAPAAPQAPVTGSDLPVLGTEKQGEDNSLDTQIKNLEAVREKAVARVQESKKDLSAVTADLDKLLLAQEKVVVSHGHSIQAYLASQRRVLEERGARLTAIRESGLDLKRLLGSLRSPIDAKLAAKRK